MPPLPLNIRRDPERLSRPLAAHPSPNVRGPSVQPRTRAVDTPRSIYSAGSVVSSLKSLHNPFKRRSQPASPAMSATSQFSARSSASSSSRSSSSTLAMPFDTGAWWKAQSSGPDSVSMEKLRDSGLSEKITSKFPVRGVENHMKRWTGFKMVLLFSVLGVSCRLAVTCPCGWTDAQLLGYGLAGLAWALSILLRSETDPRVGTSH